MGGPAYRDGQPALPGVETHRARNQRLAHLGPSRMGKLEVWHCGISSSLSETCSSSNSSRNRTTGYTAVVQGIHTGTGARNQIHTGILLRAAVLVSPGLTDVSPMAALCPQINFKYNPKDGGLWVPGYHNKLYNLTDTAIRGKDWFASSRVGSGRVSVWEGIEEVAWGASVLRREDC